MIPQKYHLCRFGVGKFPVEIKLCPESWDKILPDHEVRLWNERDSRSIRRQHIDKTLNADKWAFATNSKHISKTSLLPNN